MTATELRAIRGELNRKEFASLLGWKAGTLANYENGNPIPDDRAAHVRLFVKYQDALKLAELSDLDLAEYYKSSEIKFTEMTKIIAALAAALRPFADYYQHDIADISDDAECEPEMPLKCFKAAKAAMKLMDAKEG